MVPDILISIHADGFRLLISKRYIGVLLWSEEASSTVANFLSEKQRKRNQADIKNIMPDDFNEDEARKLYPKIYNQKINESKMLGEKILNQLKKDPYTKILQKKKTMWLFDFRVLKSIDIPSVVVESGSSNLKMLRKVKESQGRRVDL